MLPPSRLPIASPARTHSCAGGAGQSAERFEGPVSGVVTVSTPDRPDHRERATRNREGQLRIGEELRNRGLRLAGKVPRRVRV